MARKRIRDRTKLCSTLLALGHIPYADAKLMTEEQLLSLWHFDHNILHETGHPDRDKFWNLTPMLIRAHREKTRVDAKIIAKGRRIRAKLTPYDVTPKEWAKAYRKLQSRGFDKRLRRKMDGTVTKRTGG